MLARYDVTFPYYYNQEKIQKLQNQKPQNQTKNYKMLREF